VKVVIWGVPREATVAPMKHRIAFPDTTQQPLATGGPAARPSLPILTIAAHPLLHRVGERSRLEDLAAGRTIELSRLGPEFRTCDGRLVGPIDEPHVSRTPLRLVPQGRGEVVLVPPDKKGTPVFVDGAPLRGAQVCGPDALQRGVVIDLSGRVVVLLHAHADIDESLPKYGFVGESAAIHRVRAEIMRAAALASPVLIRGESGTGKELVARAIHAASSRAARPYVALNMAALNPQTAAAELFGHGRGAFTGAVQEREGHFREADGGTLFLDEIGEAPVEVQVMLLRALETGEVQPVGGRPGRRVDVRLLAATDANLERAVLRGEFRVSLLHRLGGYELRVPPLRERVDDIPRLLVHFLELELRRADEAARLAALAADTSAWLPTRFMTRLLRHAWPGNVRQLSNTARRMVGLLLTGQSLTDDVAMSADDEPGDGAAPASAEPAEARAARAPHGPTEDALLAAMERNGWQISATARDLGVSRKVLYARIAQSEHIHKARDLSPEALTAALASEGGDLGRVADALHVSVRALQLRLRELGLVP